MYGDITGWTPYRWPDLSTWDLRGMYPGSAPQSMLDSLRNWIQPIMGRAAPDYMFQGRPGDDLIQLDGGTIDTPRSGRVPAVDGGHVIFPGGRPVAPGGVTPPPPPLDPRNMWIVVAPRIADQVDVMRLRSLELCQPEPPRHSNVSVPPGLPADEGDVGNLTVLHDGTYIFIYDAHCGIYSSTTTTSTTTTTAPVTTTTAGVTTTTTTSTAPVCTPGCPPGGQCFNVHLGASVGTGACNGTDCDGSYSWAPNHDPIAGCDWIPSGSSNEDCTATPIVCTGTAWHFRVIPIAGAGYCEWRRDACEEDVTAAGIYALGGGTCDDCDALVEVN